MQRVPITVPDKAGLEKSREVSHAGQDQMHLLQLRVSGFEEHQKTRQEAPQLLEDLQVLLR